LSQHSVFLPNQYSQYLLSKKLFKVILQFYSMIGIRVSLQGMLYVWRLRHQTLLTLATTINTCLRKQC